MEVAEFERLVVAVREAGYGHDLDWSENAKPPADAEAFASEAIYVICNSGMKFEIARQIYDRVMPAVRRGEPARSAFGHPGKAGAIDTIWRDREALLEGYLAAADKVEFCGGLPWVGPITKFHLAKSFGADVAKPDVHLVRLAKHAGTTPQELCERLGAATGLRVATVDIVLWRACAIGIVKSRALAG